MRFLLWGLAVTGAAVALFLAGCSNSYLGRYVMLQNVDVEDYRHLPSRNITAGQAAPLARALNPDWMRNTPLTDGARSMPDPTSVDAFLSSSQTTAFIVLHEGKLIDERYYNGYSRASLFKTFSISKSVLSALLGIAQGEGLLSMADPVGKHVVGFSDPRLSGAKLEQLAANVSGIAYNRGFAPWASQPQMYYTTDMRRWVLSAKTEAAPGTKFAAEDISPQILAVVLESALRRSRAAQTISEYASKRLWAPMGAEAGALWNLDREGDGIEKSESGFVARAVDMARFGQLYLDLGRSNGVQILPADWVAASVSAPPAGSPNLFTEGFYRKFWWGAFRASPARTDFYANGHFGQRIYVSPTKRLVIVRMGSDNAGVDWTEVLASLADRWPIAE